VIHHRVGASPRNRGCLTNETCPDVLRLDSGDYLIIGKLPTEPHLLDDLTAHGASIGPDETAVIVPGDVMRAAALDIASRILAAPGPD
jgi:hypothetical protein